MTNELTMVPGVILRHFILISRRPSCSQTASTSIGNDDDIGNVLFGYLVGISVNYILPMEKQWRMY